MRLLFFGIPMVNILPDRQLIKVNTSSIKPIPHSGTENDRFDMRYTIVIHKEPESSYGVSVPDLPGCFSAGDTLDEALQEGSAAIRFHLDLLSELGQTPPKIQDITKHRKNPDYANGIFVRLVV